jgi:hypothetical protein
MLNKGKQKMPIEGQENATPYGKATAATQTQQPAFEQQRRFSVFANTNVAGMSRSGTNEVLTKGIEILKEAFKGITLEAPYVITLLPIDINQQVNLRLSGIVVCLSNAKDKNQGVSYHTLILEGSGPDLDSHVQQINGVPVPIRIVAGDVNNDVYASVVDQIVKRAFPGCNTHSNSAQVVPREFNWEDKEGVRSLATNAGLPCVTDIISRLPDFHDINLTEWENDAVFKLRLNFNQPDQTDYVGMTVRNTVSVVMTAEAKGANNSQELNSKQPPKNISVVGGFIDLVWAPVTPQAYNPYIQSNAMPTPKFAPRFIMTNMESMIGMTPPSQLLAMVTALALREGNGWFPYYNPKPVMKGDKHADLNDIGALNIEANVFNEPGLYGKRIDTKVASFTNQDQGKFLMMAVRPEMTLSLDVPECGSSTWYNEVFGAAAAGNPVAQQVILNAADKLTGGIFAKLYPGNETPVVINNDRIHLGYYDGKDGQTHDIRKIDHLAVLNVAGDTDPAAGRAWSDTFLREDFPLIQRLAAREKIITELAGGNVHFKGFAKRVTFAAKFVETLAIACRQAGLDTQLTNPSFSGDYQNQRASASWLSQSGMTGGNSGLFNAGFGQPVNSFGMGSGFGHRYN